MAYYVNQNGENLGPYTIGQLRSMWLAGQVTGDTLYCEEGYTEWLRLGVLADALDAPGQPLPLQSKSRFHKPFVIAGVIFGGFVCVLILSALLSHRSKFAATMQQPASPSNAGVQQIPAVASQPTTPKVSVEYARGINTFADKWDMTAIEVMRSDYVLKSRGLTLDDFNESLTKLENARVAALGYKPNIPKRHPNTPHLVAGEPMPTQDPTLTEKEESLVKTLKLAGY